MIDYIIRSGLCLTLLLGVYHLFLEREKMHRFNRFFLLFSLAFGLLAPLITIEVSSASVPVMQSLNNVVYMDQVPVVIQYDNNVQPAVNSASPLNMQFLIWFLYGLGTGIFLTRFAKNLFSIITHISRHPKVAFENSILVLLPKDSLPHSFLNYIFINGNDYKSKRVEYQLFIHELTHVRQKHSLDILFVEILRILFWFNPIFILYKKAIQLNHEFLADEAVVRSYDVSAYQYMLLERSVSNHLVQLASNLNFSLTKKRMIMMTKTTSPARAWIARLAILPVLAIAVMLFSNMAEKTIQQVPASANKPEQTKPQPVRMFPIQGSKVGIFPFLSDFPSSKTPASQQLLDEYAALVSKYETADHKYNNVSVSASDKLKMEQLFGNMNYEQQQKQRMMFGLPSSKPYPLLVPTNATFESWKDPAVYGVWIDGKHVRNEELNKYKASDFSYYDRIGLYYTDQAKKNIMDRFNLTVMYKYQLEIKTNDYIKKANARIIANKNNSIIYYVVKTPTGHNAFILETSLPRP